MVVAKDGHLAVPELEVLEDDGHEPLGLRGVQRVQQRTQDGNLVFGDLRRREGVEGGVHVSNVRAANAGDGSVVAHHLKDGVREDAYALLAPSLQPEKVGGLAALQPEGETEAPRERSLLEVVRAALLVDAGEYQTVKVERPDAGAVHSVGGELLEEVGEQLPLLPVPPRCRGDSPRRWPRRARTRPRI